MHDITRFGFADLGRSLASMAVGTAALPAAALPRFLRRLPGAVKGVYARIQSEQSVGPNIKGLATAALPVGTVLSVPFAAAASLLAGTGIGAYEGLEKGPLEIAQDMFEQAKRVDLKWVEDVLPQMHDIGPEPLFGADSDDEPFDISLTRALVAFGTGLTTAVAEGPAIAVVYVSHAPQLWWKVTRSLFRATKPELILLSVFAEVGLSAVTVLLVPFTLCGGTAYALAKGCRRGYKVGFVGAWAGVAEDLKEVHDVLRKAKRELK